MSGGGPWTPQHKKKVDASGRRLPNASAECGDDRSSSSTSIGSTLSLFLCVRFCCCCFSYVTNWKSDSVKCFCFVFLCVFVKVMTSRGSSSIKEKNIFLSSWVLHSSRLVLLYQHLLRLKNRLMDTARITR